ncbi:nucleolar complex 2 protein [Scheffersomyces coipomensis]|uniref:nucleolar complex 2 protein n=1 Tax=Scheffersomyces coipomensis TaxID=1788519 RepID=UPI00315D7746
MGKTSKQTKKFQNKHLKHTIENRKEIQKKKKKFDLRKKKPAKTEDGEEVPSGPVRKNGKAKEVFEDMSVDDFFEGGFEVPKEKKNNKKQVVAEEEDDDESSEEEDEEAMKENLKQLEDNDPEFYKYLKDNDTDLLDFEGVNPLDAISDDEDEDDGEEVEDDDEEDEVKVKKSKADKTPEEVKKIEITLELVQKWNEALEKPSTKLLRNITIAFKAAVNINNSDDGDYKYSVTDPKAFGDLMLLVLKKLPVAIQKLIKYKVTPQGVRTIPQKNPNVTQVSTILKSHAASFLTLLKDITNTETAALVLASIQELFPYYLSHRRLLKQIIGAVVEVWSITTEIDTQIATFAFLNNVSREFPKSVLETVLKSSYTAFLQNCRKTNIHTMSQINFCKNSASELYGVDETLSYQVGFEYVRQLAIHLRNSINATSNAKEGFKTIYNWQYCHSLDFWSRVVAQHCNPEQELKHKSKESPLRKLIYPLVQVTLGAIRLIPTAQFFPLRFYLIRSLMRISQSTGVFIPIFPLISEILTSTTITKPPKGSSLAAVDFEHNIKVNQAYLGTRVFQEGICEQFIELTGDFFGLYCKSIAFPELATPAILSLRRFVKKSKNGRFNKQLTQLIEKLNANATFIISKRSNVEYGPSNKHEVQLFLNDFAWEKTPLGQYNVVHRQIKEEKLRVIRESLAAEEQQKAEQKKQEQDEDAEDQDIDMIDSEQEEDEGEESD